MLACRSIGAAVRERIDRNGPTAAVAATVWRNFLRESGVWGMSGSVSPLPAILQIRAAPSHVAAIVARPRLSLECGQDSRYIPAMPPESTPLPWCPKCASASVTLTLRSSNGAYCLCADCGHCWYHQRRPVDARLTNPPAVER